MPNGYTAQIIDGNDSAYDYCLRAARGFGFTIHQRDNSPDEPPKSREPNSWYQERYDEAKRAEEEFNNLDASGLNARYYEYVKKTVESNTKSLRKAAEAAALIESVRGKLKAIAVPEKFANFYKNINDWLDETQNFDANPYITDVLTFDEWIDFEWQSIDREISYYENAVNEERERVAEQHEWIQDFYEMIEPLKALDTIPAD